MKTLLFFLLPFAMLAGPPGTMAFVGVNVSPMIRDTVLYRQTVLIENGRIRQIGDASKLQAPANARVVDASGKFLLPGFFDMHAHFFYEQGDNVNTCEAELKLMLANGLTTVRIQCGDPVYLEAREEVASGRWVGPALSVSSPQFVGAWPWPGKVFGMICKTPEEAVAAVKKCKKEGYNEIKITFMVKRDVYDAILRTAKAEGIPVTGHVGPLVKLPAALEAGEQIEHMDEFIDMLLPDTSYNHGQSVSDMNIWRKRAWATVPYLDESKIPALAEMVSKAGIYVTPTNYFFFSSFADSASEEACKHKADYAFIPKTVLDDRWKVREHYWKSPPPAADRARYVLLRKKITNALYHAGVKLMAGSDSPEWFLVQGISLHDELKTFVEAGLSPYAALQTATKNPAAYLKMKNKGTVETGKDADLLLLDKNPLENIENTKSISAVMRGGKLYLRPALDLMLDEARQELAK